MQSPQLHVAAVMSGLICASACTVSLKIAAWRRDTVMQSHAIAMSPSVHVMHTIGSDAVNGSCPAMQLFEPITPASVPAPSARTPFNWVRAGGAFLRLDGLHARPLPIWPHWLVSLILIL